ncbi:MAG TPA: hypothetical protein VNK23_14890 [Candidatus Dormibacteraeota bacterium]|nr:hypothetical protein [Candidatus Dormibacteraeota bacterium]
MSTPPNGPARSLLSRPAIFFSILLSLVLYVPSAGAVPSFSRQTGFPCSSCHTTPPELTPLGRIFKLSGYTLAGTGMSKIEKKRQGKETGLELLATLPLSVFFETSFTSTNKPQPGLQNGSFEFPQDVSLFLAGEWSTHVGSFVQFTYDAQDDHFTWDNTDIRYANSGKFLGKDLMYGITFNNNPTLEDLWNSTPAFGFPFVSNDFAPSPSAAVLVNGSLAQDVAGAGGYGMWDNHFYLDATLYRSDHIGAAQPFDGAGYPINIQGVAPYWRFAVQDTMGNNYIEVGTYGMHVKSTPNFVTAALSDGYDSYTDVAADFQFDRTIPQLQNDVLSVRGTYIHENSSLNGTFNQGGSDFVNHHLNTVQANVEYHRGNRYSGAFGWFNTTGTADPTLFAAGTPISGSTTGSPNSDGYLLNLSWWPAQNIDVAAQYTGYLKFDGGGTNYDGSGRNASDNNTLYLLARFLF